jgi:hypothetical protein
MTATWETHDIAYPESFDARRPVLAAASSLNGRWRVTEDGKTLEVDLPLSSYSPHERAVIEFAINPHFTAENIFGGLDRDVRRALAKAIASFFGPGGAGDRTDPQ